MPSRAFVDASGRLPHRVADIGGEHIYTTPGAELLDLVSAIRASILMLFYAA